MQNNYDRIAPAYDYLSRVIFGKAQINAQTALLPFIVKGDRVLIAGGGTGWVLDEITKIHPSGLDIVYVEISDNMLSMSKKRNVGLNKITFINRAVEETELTQPFTAIFTGFFFDNFNLPKAEHIFNYLDSLLTPGGRWLMTDFKQNPGRSYIWQQMMLKSMYFFFRLICKIEASHLVDMTPLFKRMNYHPIFEQSGYGNFICSTVYEKISPFLFRS